MQVLYGGCMLSWSWAIVPVRIYNVIDAPKFGITR